MEKREVSLIEGLKGIYNEADKQGIFNPVKEKLFNKARIPLATAALMTGKAEDQIKGFIKDKVPDINVGTKLGGDKVGATWKGWNDWLRNEPEGQGDCDRDSDCAGNLKCAQNPYSLPGVNSNGLFGGGRDFCYDPTKYGLPDDGDYLIFTEGCQEGGREAEGGQGRWHAQMAECGSNHTLAVGVATGPSASTGGVCARVGSSDDATCTAVELVFRSTARVESTGASCSVGASSSEPSRANNRNHPPPLDNVLSVFDRFSRVGRRVRPRG